MGRRNRRGVRFAFASLMLVLVVLLSAFAVATATYAWTPDEAQVQFQSRLDAVTEPELPDPTVRPTTGPGLGNSQGIDPAGVPGMVANGMILLGVLFAAGALIYAGAREPLVRSIAGGNWSSRGGGFGLTGGFDWVANAWSRVKATAGRLWEHATDWLRNGSLVGRDFLAGAGIELADATGLGLLRLALARWDIDPDRGASGAYHLGRALGGLAATVVGLLEMIGGIGMMGGGGAGGALLALPTGGVALVPATAVVVGGTGLTAAGARTSYLGVRSTLNGARDYVRFAQEAKDERHIWGYDPSKFGELGVGGVVRDDIKKGLQFLHDTPTGSEVKPWPWNMKDTQVLKKIAEIAENWGVAGWRYAHTNQGIRHFWNWERKLELGRYESRYKNLGRILANDANAFPPTATGFQRLTTRLDEIRRIADERVVVRDFTYYAWHGDGGRSVWTIERGGLLDTAYVLDTKDALKKIIKLRAGNS